MSTALGLAMQISANTAQLATAVADVNPKSASEENHASERCASATSTATSAP